MEVLPPPWPQPNAYMLTQRRFIHRNITKEPFEDHKWFIPITYSTSENQNFENTEAIDFMSFNRSITTIINLPRKVDWIILNHQIAGSVLYLIFSEATLPKLLPSTLSMPNT